MRIGKRTHYIALFITLSITLACIFLIPRVTVNSDMTHYLPDSSRMKAGIEIIREEFGQAQADAAGVKVMFEGLESERLHDITEKFAAMPEVDGIASCKTTEDGRYTLFELNVSPNIDQKQLGWKIKNDFEENVVVETSQDGSTPPLYVIILAFSLVIVILLAMSTSWLDPLIILVSVGLAIVINIGTNALLPSVSITTNYIGAILQLVLSMDFSIILINRYRQEKGTSASPVRAVNAAIVRALPSISSSALTTIVGLLMLVFMKLKIGMDMGVVLAKGVLCSLICTFTALPAFILLLNKALDKTVKKVFLIPTDRLAGFCLKHKTLLSVLFVIIFISAYYYHDKTPVSFSTKGESVIEKRFPVDNTAILLYDNADEGKIRLLSDSILSCEGMRTFISYPTLMEKPYTADEMLPLLNNSGANRLPPEALRLVYYIKHGDEKSIRMNLGELAGFITGTCLESPLMEGRIDEQTKEKINLFVELTNVKEENPCPDESVVEPIKQAVEESGTPAATPDVVESVPEVREEETMGNVPVQTAVTKISLADFIPKLYAYRPDETVKSITVFADTALMNRSLTASEMSAVIGSTPSQTGMVYMLYKSKSGKITPYQYVHFLCDDLFNRKALSSMAKPSEKQELRLRQHLMDMAMADEKQTPSEMVSLLAQFNIGGISEEIIKEIAGFESIPHVESVVVADTIIPPVAAAPIPKTEQMSTIEPLPIPHKAKEQPTADIPDFDKRYTSAQMTSVIAALGETLDASLMTLVYAYYGSVHFYDEGWTMSLKEFMEVLSDIPLDSSGRKEILAAKSLLDEGVSKLKGDKHSLAVIITDLPDESPQTYAAVDKIQDLCDAALDNPHYLIGESVMFNEMRHSFKKEMKLITWLTVLAILIIIIIGLRALFPSVVLVMTVMTAVFVNVIFSGVFNGSVLYIAYLITQSMLMGATIDYGILFANYYKERRRSQPVNEAVKDAYQGAIPTISTSGLIMIVATAIMAIFTEDAAISAILGSLSVGAIVTVLLILTVLPSLLAVIDKLKNVRLCSKK